jgi:hypothetical protein
VDVTCWRNMHVKLDRWHKTRGSYHSALFFSLADGDDDDDVAEGFYTSAPDGSDGKQQRIDIQLFH